MWKLQLCRPIFMTMLKQQNLVLRYKWIMKLIYVKITLSCSAKHTCTCRVCTGNVWHTLRTMACTGQKGLKVWMWNKENYQKGKGISAFHNVNTEHVLWEKNSKNLYYITHRITWFLDFVAWYLKEKYNVSETGCFTSEIKEREGINSVTSNRHIHSHSVI